ncbi:MAG: hypothetical protein H8D49_05285 [Dehalococcoidia bacterium]|nr:hypothetical protein [Dehalococcoidia bacterium]
MEDRLIKKLMTSMKCEECGQNYESFNIDILGHRKDMWFLRALCSSCHTQCLVAAVVREDKVVEEVDDFTMGEMNKNQCGAIEIKDVLDMRNFLVDFGGDFSSFFEQEKLR